MSNLYINYHIENSSTTTPLTTKQKLYLEEKNTLWIDELLANSAQSCTSTKSLALSNAYLADKAQIKEEILLVLTKNSHSNQLIHRLDETLNSHDADFSHGEYCDLSIAFT